MSRPAAGAPAAPTDADPAHPDQWLAQRFGSLPAMLARQARNRPRHPALVMDAAVQDFAELDRCVEQVARTLQQRGLKPGDVMAICADTSMRYIHAFMGALRAGVVVTPLAPSSSASHLDAMLCNSGATLVLRDGAVAAAWPVTGTDLVSLDDTPEAGEPWSTWLDHSGKAAQAIEPQPDWPFNLIYSSGTTGTPKGIVQSWGMRWAHLHRAMHNGYGPDTVSLCATPLYSNTSLVAVLPTLALGGTLVMMRKFDALHYLQLAQRHRATHTMLVPVQYQRLMDCPAFDAHDLSALQHKFCTSAPFKAALKAEVLRRWPGRLIEYYGMTEGGVRCELHCHLHPHKLHTVGQPAADAMIRFIDTQGQEVPGESGGEIVGHSAGMMSGYHGLPEKTREVEWFDAQGVRFIRSGDVGRLDADGFLVLSDRIKDLVITGGFNVYPSDIEAALAQHPAVAECAVIGVPSTEWGETPVAYAVLRAGHAMAPEALRQWLNTRVGKTQRLAEMHLLETLPRSEIGKVLKRELQARHAREHALPPAAK